MFKLLVKLFVKNSDRTSDPVVRRAYGTLCSVYGIFLNILLFAGKYLAGIISGSVAITADAFNNLTDAGSAVITLLGFAIAGKKPDLDHPFGHGRVEYLSGLVLSCIIMLTGFELGKSSVEKIITPEPVEGGLLPAIILVASILVKVYMYSYNRATGKRISSAAMESTATDSLTDSIATAVVLASMLLAQFTGINIDGWAGLAVAVFIVIAGFNALKETLSPLLGKSPDREFVESIERIVMSYDEVKGIHDLIVHDYGPGRVIISLHAEVDGRGNIFELHDAIDNAERRLKDELGCLATIHLDPIESDNTEVSEHRAQVLELVHRIDGRITVHDFRMVPGPTHINLIFDAVLPSDLRMSDEEAEHEIERMVSQELENHFAVVTIDRGYV